MAIATSADMRCLAIVALLSVGIACTKSAPASSRQSVSSSPAGNGTSADCFEPKAGSNSALLTASDLEHGRKQVEVALKQVPDLAFFPNEPWVEWAAKRFAGSATGTRIYMATTPPTLASMSAHRVPSRAKPGMIYLKPGISGSRIFRFTAYWFSVIYELHNIAHVTEFGTAIRDSMAGRLSRSEFTWRMAEIEFAAKKETARFLKERWDPWAVAHGLADSEAPHFGYRGVLDVDNVREFVARFVRYVGYPESAFGFQYDRLVRECRR